MSVEQIPVSKVTFRDKTEITIPIKDGKALKEHLLSLKAPAFLEIKGEMYSSNLIVSITEAIDFKTVKNVFPDAKLLPTVKEKPHYPCGRNSVYFHVIEYADKHNEIKKLKKKSYREKIREALLAKYPGKFCDYKNDYHVCLSNPKPLDVSLAKMIVKS